MQPAAQSEYIYVSGMNLYDHFIDFLNIYMTQHMNGSFSTDINIMVWYTVSIKCIWPWPNFQGQILELERSGITTELYIDK